MRSHDEALELFDRSIRLAYFAANKYREYFNGFSEQGPEDVAQVCLIGLWHAACRFDARYNTKFATYAMKSMQGHLNDALRILKRHRKLPTAPLAAIVDSEDEEVPGENVPGLEDTAADTCEAIVAKDFIERLADQQKQVMQLRREGYRQSEIAKIIGVSQPRVSKIVREIIAIYNRATSLR